MVRRYIPLNPLRAFEAAARHLSFTRAAVELNVTHAAVSQQVRVLEEQLRCALFVRVSRGLVLTHEGESLLPVLNEARLIKSPVRLISFHRGNFVSA